MVCDAYRRLVKVGSLDLRKSGERRQEVNAAVSDFSFIALEGSEGRQAQCDLGNPPGIWCLALSLVYILLSSFMKCHVIKPSEK